MKNDSCREGNRCVDHPFGCYNHPHTCGCRREKQAAPQEARTGVMRFRAPGPWVTRELRECVLASDYDAAIAQVKRLEQERDLAKAFHDLAVKERNLANHQLDKARKKIAELEEELHGTARLVVKQGTLLTRVVNTIRGRPPENGLWSVHDAPELAERVVTLIRKGMAAADTQRLADMKDWRDECSAQLRAWTIFPGARD